MMKALCWVWNTTQKENRGLMLAFWAHVALLVFGLCALPFDHRLILGINPWIKPIKFDLSVMIFLMTVAILLSLLRGRRKARARIGWGLGIALIVEDTIISMQSLRGVRSHMNLATLFDGLAFAVMGLLVVFSTVLIARLLVLYCVERPELPVAITWGIRLGLVALLAGSAEGVLMVAVFSAHTVGAPDGLAGLPFVNWSRDHGDLRVAHFFALHALQVMPLLGWTLSRTRWTQGIQLGTLLLGFGGYMAAVGWMFEEAVRGRPLLG